MKEKQIGIYKIECLKNGMVYVGSSIDIQARLTWHKSHLINNTHYKKGMQEDFNKYGIENFVFEIVELTTEKRLKEKEIYYIKELKAVEHGYNTCISTSGRYKKTSKHSKKLSKKRIFSDEHKKHLQDACRRNIENGIKYNHNDISVTCFETGKVYQSITQAQKDTKASGISACVNGKQNTSGGYHWFITGTKYILPNKIHGRCKKVICKETNQVFDSLIEASKQTGCNLSGIGQCCNKKAKYTKDKNNNKFTFDFYNL